MSRKVRNSTKRGDLCHEKGFFRDLKFKLYWIIYTFLKEKAYNLEKRLNNMALVLETKYFYEGITKSEGAAKIRLAIPKSILSTPYELKEGTIIKGEILKLYEKINDYGGSIRTIQAIPLPLKIEFILTSANIGTDSLYITKDSWLKIRDYGLFPEKTLVDLKLESFVDSGKDILIYPKRDVRA